MNTDFNSKPKSKNWLDAAGESLMEQAYLSRVIDRLRSPRPLELGAAGGSDKYYVGFDPAGTDCGVITSFDEQGRMYLHRSGKSAALNKFAHDLAARGKLVMKMTASGTVELVAPTSPEP